MEFNQEVHIKLDAIFSKYNFKIIEETKNNLKLKSPHLIIILVYNHYEKSNNIYFVTLSEIPKTIEIDNEILRRFFKSNLRLSSSSIEKFVSKLAIFLDREAKSLLQGNIQEIIQLERYSMIRDKLYTDKFK